MSRFQPLRAGGPDCPSDLVLDRLAAGELQGPERTSAQAHIASCPACGARASERSFAAFPEADPRAMLAAIRSGLEAPQGLRARALALLDRLLAHRAPLVAAAGLAAVLIAVRWVSPHGLAGGGPPPPAGLALHLRPEGEAVRLLADLPAAGYVGVLSVTPDGRLLTVWPPPGTPAGPPLPAGAGRPLPGALVQRGAGTLHLVHCPLPTGPAACQPRGPGAQPACPPGCALASPAQ